MATSTNKLLCVKFEKVRATSKCAGCSHDYCYDHLQDHRQELNVQLDHIGNNHNHFRQRLNKYINNSQIHAFTQQIDQWEKESINKIQQKANECRELLKKHINENIHQIEINLNKQTDQLRNIVKENDFNEIDLNELNEKLKELERQLHQPSNISIQKNSTSSFINEITVVTSSDESIGHKTETKRSLNWDHKIYSIRSTVNGKFVTAEHGGERPLIARADKVDSWEKFKIKIVNKELNHIALKASVNDKYVTAEHSGYRPLIANQVSIDKWETFEVIEVAHNIVTLRSIANNRFVCAENGGRDSLIANRDTADLWGKFEILPFY
ncbi:unnamed protein product [Adineta steineri]|uniref:Uncharacterized protein n=1 Tax=Adineta steineri TaxID=433720 RepID=A0A815LNE6_9BILA|nr:unnamed protein product [Adineta steineri]CAF3765336.1 unnamed protein product [Adineta steineri]